MPAWIPAANADICVGTRHISAANADTRATNTDICAGSIDVCAGNTYIQISAWATQIFVLAKQASVLAVSVSAKDISVLVTNTDICCLLVLLFQYGSDLLDFCFGLVGKMCLGIVLGMIGGGVGVFVTCARSMFGDHSELS